MTMECSPPSLGLLEASLELGEPSPRQVTDMQTQAARKKHIANTFPTKATLHHNM